LQKIHTRDNANVMMNTDERHICIDYLGFWESFWWINMLGYTIYTLPFFYYAWFCLIWVSFARFKFISQIMIVEEDIEALRINEVSKRGLP